MSYLVWKLVHIGAAIVFLGNITTGLFWAAHAHKSRNFTIIASTFNGIILSDRWFTIPGVLVIVGTGIAAALEGDLPILGTSWILWPIILFSFSGVVFGMWVVPLQYQIADLARTSDTSEQAWEIYAKLYKRWELWGLVALVLPLAALVIMVLKPALPGV